VRLFVALEIPEAVRSNLTALIDELRTVDTRSTKNKPRWIRPENLHVTLKFIGHVAPERLDPIRSELADVRSTAAVTVRFHGLGFFPNARRPRVLWAGVEASPNLAAIAGDIDQRLSKLDIQGEQRAFTPHLTLARFEPPGVSPTLQVAIEKDKTRDFGELHANAFHLIESKLKSSGAEYTTLQSFSFASEA
jgi:RNA 2',3'-cyclic 3'-phosphodiesterase